MELLRDTEHLQISLSDNTYRSVADECDDLIKKHVSDHDLADDYWICFPRDTDSIFCHNLTGQVTALSENIEDDIIERTLSH